MKNRILELRQKNKISQSKVAKALNITRQAVSLYERGEHEPKLETWQKLADFFDVSVPYLQGIESDYLNITSNTKWAILEVVNDAYFDGLDLDNPKKIEQFSVLTSKINKLIQLKKLDTYPIDFYSSKMIKDYDFEMTENIEEYWKNNFSFLFQDARLIELANKLVEIEYDSNKLEERSLLEKQMATLVVDNVNKNLQNNFASKSGKKIIQLIGKKLNAEYTNLITNLLTADSSEDIEQSFFSFEDNVDTIKLHLEQEKIFDNSN